jgi:hypothetical protein
MARLSVTGGTASASLTAMASKIPRRDCRVDSSLMFLKFRKPSNFAKFSLLSWWRYSAQLFHEHRVAVAILAHHYFGVWLLFWISGLGLISLFFGGYLFSVRHNTKGVHCQDIIRINVVSKLSVVCKEGRVMSPSRAPVDMLPGGDGCEVTR